MGQIGCGKTTLFNKLCNTLLEAGWSERSITRGLFIRNSAHGDNTITMIDTPGTQSKEDAAKHALLLKESFTCQPINAIFVVIPVHCRSEMMLDTFDETMKPISSSEDCKNRVIIIVSKFDTCEEGIKSIVRK